MVRMFVRHTVANYGVWRRAYNAFDKERKGLGVKAHAVFRTAGKPNDITLWHDFATLAKAKSFAGNPRLKEVMKGAGVTSAPAIWFAKAA